MDLNLIREKCAAGETQYLRGADLINADLSGAYLRGADSSGANLSGANLRDANLRDANLRDTNLRCANLSYANLSYADLCRANLIGANLIGANLSEANLSNARYSVLTMLRINWGDLPDGLTLELMRHDAEFIGLDKMQAWADGGACPYQNSERDFIFQEKRSLWSAGEPSLRGCELFEALCKEKQIKI